MDDARFDSLTRIIGLSGTRRGALSLLGGSLGLLGLAAAEADRKKRRRRRKRRKRRKSCAGKNTCAKTAFCGIRAECACFRPAGGGKSFCGSAFPRFVSNCTECVSGETCIDGIGPGVPCNNLGTACVPRCPFGK